MLVTINTDASFHPTKKVGAFAFWVVCDRFKIKKAGFFRDLCRNPTDAESKAILNAFHVLLSAHERISKIIINTDSTNSIAIFENDCDKINKYSLHFGAPLRKKFKRIINKYVDDKGSFKPMRTLTVEFRHVKAHSGKDDARSYVNEWCDTNAKHYMWKRFHELNLKTH
jgi:ribonuclease HI